MHDEDREYLSEADWVGMPTNTGHELFDSDDPALKAHNRAAAEGDLHQLRQILRHTRARDERRRLQHAIKTAEAALATYDDDRAAARLARSEVRRLDERRGRSEATMTVLRPVRSTGSRRSRSPRRQPPARRESTGDDPPDDDPEPPERLCACGCGRSIAHKRAGALTFSPACRKRVERHGAQQAVARRADPYLQLAAWELTDLTRRVHDGCRCNGHHILDPADGTCVKCGHPRDRGLWHRTAGARLIGAGSPEWRHPRPLELAVAA